MNLALQNQITLILTIVILLGIFFIPSYVKEHRYGNNISIKITVVLAFMLYAMSFYFVGLSLILRSVSILLFFVLLIFISRVSRDMLYMFAVIFILFCPILLLVDLESPARYTAAISFVVLSIGVFRDLIDEKISNN